VDAPTIQSIAGLLFALVILGLYVWSIIWVYSDAENRGNSGCLVALLVMLLGWPIGLIAWIAFRPRETESERARKIGTESDKNASAAWTLKMSLKKAAQLESTGRYDEALAVFTELAKGSDNPHNRELAQQAIERLQRKLSDDRTA